MWKKTCVCCVAPWVPPPRADTRVTVPPPPGGEVGGSFGISTGYSDRLARTPYWKRMALSGTYAFRMQENATYYPMSTYHPGQYDLRYTPMPYPDSHHPAHRSLLEIGEPRQIPLMHIPVICLVNIFDDEAGDWLGKKHETVYVSQSTAREVLLPQRWALYATKEAYELLRLPVAHHIVFDSPTPKTQEEYKKKILSRQHYEEERWQYDVEFLFRKYLNGELPAEWATPPAVTKGDASSSAAAAATLAQEEEERKRWEPGGVEEVMWMAQVYSGGEEKGAAAGQEGSATGAGGVGRSAASGVGGRKGPLKLRKAKKVKLF